MANLRRYEFRRLSIIGGEVQQVRVRTGGVNVLRFINWGTKDLKISLVSDPINYPMAIANAGGGTNNLMDPAGIEHVWLYSEDTGDFGMVEMDVEDPLIILAMESVVANLMTSLPTGGNHVGSVGIDVGGTAVSAAAAFPVAPGTGADMATQTTLAAVLAKLSADPATQTTLAALAAEDFATQTTLAAVLAKLSADPATQTTLAAILAAINTTTGVPVKPANGVAPVVTNAPGAGEVTIKAAAGRVFSFVSDVAGSLRNVTGTDLYLVQANVTVNLTRPLEFAAAIIFNAAGAGNIYTQHE